jgi:hypothetical protein
MNAITNLVVSQSLGTNIKLSWSAPTGNIASQYIIKYSLISFSIPGTWDTATIVVNGLTPKIAGSPESLVVTGLATNVLYYFAVKAVDSNHVISALSNEVSIRTSATLFILDSYASFTGETYASMVWRRPSNATSSILYQYKIYDVTATEPNTWTYLGNDTTLKDINIGNLKSMYVYSFFNLTSGTTYRIKLRATDDLTSTDIRGVITLDVTPSPFLSVEPNPERLMRGLDEKYDTMNKDSLLYQLYYDFAIHLNTFYRDFKNLALPQLDILTATDRFLNNWGVLFNTGRVQGESDSDYASRIVHTFLSTKGTKSGMLKALKPYAKNGTVSLIEGSNDTDIMVFDESYFGEQGQTINFSGDTVMIPYDLNGLLGTTEISRSTAFGSESFSGFSFVVRILIDSSVRDQYFKIVKVILDQYKLAGTSYQVYDLANGAYVTY